MLLLVHGAITASTAAADCLSALNNCCYDTVTVLRLLRLQDSFRCCVVLGDSMCRAARCCCCCSTSTSLQCCLQLPDVRATATVANTRPNSVDFGTTVIDGMKGWLMQCFCCCRSVHVQSMGMQMPGITQQTLVDDQNSVLTGRSQRH